MSDITLCTGGESPVCPKKGICERHYQYNANGFGDSVFVDLPYDFSHKSCEYFMKAELTKIEMAEYQDKLLKKLAFRMWEKKNMVNGKEVYKPTNAEDTFIVKWDDQLAKIRNGGEGMLMHEAAMLQANKLFRKYAK